MNKDRHIIEAARKYETVRELIAFTEGYIKGLEDAKFSSSFIQQNDYDNGYRNAKRYPGLKAAIIESLKQQSVPMTSKGIAKSIHHAYDMPIAVLKNRVGTTLNNLFKKGFVAKARDEYNYVVYHIENR